MVSIFKRRVGKKSNRSRSGDFFLVLFILFMAAIMGLPLVLTVANSLKPADEFFLFPPRLWPKSLTGKNFEDLFRLMSTSWIPFSRYVFNTVFITTVGTAAHIISTSLAAYPVAKYSFPGSAGLDKIVTFSLMFSGAVTSIPAYMVMASLGFIDTYWSFIIPALGGTLGFFMMRSFMGQIHDSLLDAAKIDGASELRIFWKIVMPNVKSAWLTLMIFQVQALWNATNTTYIYSEPLKTLPYAISQITSGGIARAGASAAATVIMMVIPVTIFIITQSNIIETMGTSGIKE